MLTRCFFDLLPESFSNSFGVIHLFWTSIDFPFLPDSYFVTKRRPNKALHLTFITMPIFCGFGSAIVEFWLLITGDLDAATLKHKY